MIKFLDTETCGFVGPIVLIQTKEVGKDTLLHHVWKRSVRETLSFIEALMECTLGAYNMTFDSFHIAKTYNTLLQFPQNRLGFPPDIAEYAKYQESAWKGKCLKPKGVIDYFLILKELEFKELIKTKSVLIKDVPVVLGPWLVKELDKLEFNPLLFGNKSRGYEWSVTRTSEHFIDLKLSFAPSTKLKSIIKYMFNVDVLEYGITPNLVPDERCPFSNSANSLYNPCSGNWEKFIRYHIKFWANQGIDYAIQDVVCLELLHLWLAGQIKNDSCRRQPLSTINWETFSHMNSELAWAVGVNRQRGFDIRLDKAIEKMNEIENNPSPAPTSPREALIYLHEVADSMEKPLITNTDEDSLLSISEFIVEEGGPSPVATRAKEIIDARHEEKQMLFLKRLVWTQRYHPDFNIVGTQTNRMSGAGGINPQGIDRTLRYLFFPDVSGGDFDAQEMGLAATIYKDKQLFQDLSEGVDVHTWSAKNLYPKTVIFNEKTNSWVMVPADSVTKEQRYDGKNKVNFPILYGSMVDGIQHSTRLPMHIVKFAYDQFFDRYKGAARTREEIVEKFTALHQPAGLGTRVSWREPQEYIESIFGWRRYFSTEYKICRFLFDLASRVPEHKEMVIRKERDQTASGATRTALYAAAFNINAKIIRIACNHIIQSPGAELTKRLQLAIWNLQPSGVCDWLVQVFNVHDEVICPNSIPNKVEAVVQEQLTKFRETFPLVKMEWKSHLKDWSEK